MRRSFLRPRWILTTLLVIAALAVLVRLGIWQLDRLQERRIFNGKSWVYLIWNTGPWMWWVFMILLNR
jgi:hypothetical protein